MGNKLYFLPGMYSLIPSFRTLLTTMLVMGIGVIAYAVVDGLTTEAAEPPEVDYVAKWAHRSAEEVNEKKAELARKKTVQEGLERTAEEEKTALETDEEWAEKLGTAGTAATEAEEEKEEKQADWDKSELGVRDPGSITQEALDEQKAAKGDYDAAEKVFDPLAKKLADTVRLYDPTLDYTKIHVIDERTELNNLLDKYVDDVAKLRVSLDKRNADRNEIDGQIKALEGQINDTNRKHELLNDIFDQQNKWSMKLGPFNAARKRYKTANETLEKKLVEAAEIRQIHQNNTNLLEAAKIKFQNAREVFNQIQTDYALAKSAKATELEKIRAAIAEIDRELEALEEWTPPTTTEPEEEASEDGWMDQSPAGQDSKQSTPVANLAEEHRMSGLCQFIIRRKCAYAEAEIFQTIVASVSAGILISSFMILILFIYLGKCCFKKCKKFSCIFRKGKENPEDPESSGNTVEETDKNEKQMKKGGGKDGKKSKEVAPAKETKKAAETRKKTSASKDPPNEVAQTPTKEKKSAEKADFEKKDPEKAVPGKKDTEKALAATKATLDTTTASKIMLDSPAILKTTPITADKAAAAAKVTAPTPETTAGTKTRDQTGPLAATNTTIAAVRGTSTATPLK